MNILLITADDMDAGTPGAFGGPAGVTPALDRLAAEGMIFRHAHVAVAVCQPSRSAILSGLLPHHNGAEGFGPIADGVPVFTDLLRDAGYRVGILGKVQHLKPVERFGWQTCLDIGDLGMGRDPRKYADGAAQFFRDAAENNQPWFLMANAHDPHRPFHGSVQEQEKFSSEQREGIPAPAETYAAGENPVPVFLPDLSAVRTEYAQYLSSARRCDQVVEAVLDAVAAAGAAGDTLVVFLSDNGMAFPFAKANCYLQSTHTPLIIRWPGVTAPGSVDDHSFVSMLDLFPTFCEAAGVAATAELDGRSLLPLLQQEQQPGRDAVYTVFHETFAKRRFEMRCVQDARFGYIWNQWSDGETEYRAESMEGLTWNAMVEAGRTRPEIARRNEVYLRRTPEELYDLQQDPHSLHNLAGEASARGELERYRRLLAEWMSRNGDPLLTRFPYGDMCS